MCKFNFQWLFIYLTLSVCLSLNGQDLHTNNLKSLDRLLINEEYNRAKEFITKQIDSLIKTQKFYELTDYVYYLGQIEANLHNSKAAIKLISDFEAEVESLTSNKKALRQLALETGSFYESLGDSETAKDYNLKALEITKRMSQATGKDLALIESNLGVFYSRLGDIPTAIKYHKNGLKSLQSDSNSKADSYYITYNSLGGMMWYTSKFDSAIYYYKRAEKTLKSLEKNPWNSFYRPASLYNNLAGVYSVKGDLEASIYTMRKTINNLNSYLKEDVSDKRRTYAREFLYQAIENYAGIYKDIGDYKKAKQLLSYAFELKQKHFVPESPEIAKGKVLLGQVELALKNYENAQLLLDEGIQYFLDAEAEYTYWLADAYHSKALLSEENNDKVKARIYFEKSESYYKASLGTYFDERYLDFTISASNFYSKIGLVDKALSMANEAISYIKDNQGSQTLLEYYQLLNLADIFYQNDNYQQAQHYCKKAMSLINSAAFKNNTKLNTLRINSHKASTILKTVKINLKLNSHNNEAFFKSQLSDIKVAIELLEKQISILTNESSTSLFIQDNANVFLIAKQLSLKLYKITKNTDYLKAVLGYHESMVYHKIRSRLNSKSVQLTANLPKEILEEEQKLKAKLNDDLDEKLTIDSYIQHEKKWSNFLEELRQNHPDYYKLRYASISRSLNQVEHNIPESSTVIRYIFIADTLYGFVITSEAIRMVELDAVCLKQLISQVNKKAERLQPTYKLQLKLYDKLWKPLEMHVKTKSVVVIPDRELFNLSFELLTSQESQKYDHFTQYSLLAKHNLSYNYSLLLIDKNSKPVGYNSNFIGFAPEFNEAMKTNYKIAVKDSSKFDYAYLKLIPQPFAKDLAKNYSKYFDGNSFLNEKASKQIFTQHAKEHKIIHIGTHAESDNISPRFSRLIFAKTSGEDNNSLYAYEIYNQNLASNLTILTACETGKPNYQPGEGMISLAHAFNYAGSESILTSLWKIDEKSSAEILEYFYKNIGNGLKKDEALKAAKLEYISHAEGRTITPHYWAGLVLIGDTSAIDQHTNINLWLWLFILLIAIVTLTTYSKIRKRTKDNI